MTTAATVVSLSGEAFARSADGSMRRLSAGDKIQQGEVVITSAGAQVNLLTVDGQTMAVGGQESMQFGPESVAGTAPSAAEAAVAGAAAPAVAAAPGEINVEQLLEQEAAAAGLGAGGENGGNSFVRLLRITEELTPLSYEFPNPAEGEILPAVGIEGLNVPSAGDLAIALDEDDIHYSWWDWPDFYAASWLGEFWGDVGFPLPFYDNGNSDEAPGDDLPDPSPTRMEGTLNFSYGGDGTGDITFNLPTAALTSGGLEVKYWVSDDGHTMVGYVELGGGMQPNEGDKTAFRMQDGSWVKIIFSGEITDAASGDFAFTLFGPLDHPEAGTEDNLIIPFEFTVTDITGDTAVGTLTVDIDDDMPTQLHSCYRPTVDEDDILTWQSQGTSPNDGNKWDGSYTGNPHWEGPGPANVSGWLGALVSFGADGPACNAFSLSTDEAALANLAERNEGLSSQGQELSYRIVGDTLIGYVAYGGGEPPVEVALASTEGGYCGERLVFTLELDGNGHYTFSLFDQLDHDGWGQDILPLDLSAVIVATDRDGDSITLDGGFVINVRDDVPVAVCDHNMVVEGATLTVNAAHGVLANDLPGADDDVSVFSAGNSPFDGIPLGEDGAVTLDGKYGTLTLHADGSYEYQADPNAIRHDATDTFYYTIKDGDGDLSTTALNIYVDDVTLKVYAWSDNRDNGVFDYKYDNRTETFTVDVDHWQNTGDGGKWGGKGFGLPEGENFDTKSHPLVNYKLDPINIQHDASITFTFQSEGAGYKNAVGWYEMDGKGNPTVGHVIWSNASADGSGGSLETGDTAVAAVTAGMKIGFFMIPDGYDSGLPGTVYFQNGHAYADAAHTQLINSNDNDWQLSDGNKYTNNPDTDPVWFSSSANLDGLQHAIAGTASGNPSNVLNVAFEDLGGGGDKDYNDVVFKVDLGTGNDVSFNEVIFNLGVDLPDVALKSATIDFALGNGDTISWDTAMADKSGLTVTVDKSGDVTITADDATKGSLVIEDLLDTFKINVGFTGAGEDYTKVDADQRTATVSVMDIYGNESSDVTAVFNMMVKTDPNPT